MLAWLYNYIPYDELKFVMALLAFSLSVLLGCILTFVALTHLFPAE
jgi:hypothetical protein